jgi:hypothetical protein
LDLIAWRENEFMTSRILELTTFCQRSVPHICKEEEPQAAQIEHCLVLVMMYGESFLWKSLGL